VKEENLQVGGLPRALAISPMFGMTVFIPFPLPSTFAMRRGILYLLKKSSIKPSFNLKAVI